MADVKYLGGTLPVPEDYADCNSPPNVRAVCSTPLEPAAKYMREVIAMRDRFADFFKRGRFIDTEGFCFEGKDSVARGFLAKDGRLGVVVWNYGDEPQAVSVSAEGRELLGVFAPGETEPVKETEPVPAESVRFYLWSAKEGFAIAGPDKAFRWAKAKIEGDSILAWNETIPNPAFVRYAWANNPECTLYNAAGLPAVPFRTDK